MASQELNDTWNWAQIWKLDFIYTYTALHICRFCIHGVNQPQIENAKKKKKKKKKKILESPNKAKLEFGIISNLKMNLKYMGGCAQIICKFRGCCLVAKSRLTLCDSMDYSPLGSPVPGISQARILEWVAISFSRGSFQPRDRICVSWSAGGFFTTEPPGKPICKYLHHFI